MSFFIWQSRLLRPPSKISAGLFPVCHRGSEVGCASMNQRMATSLVNANTSLLCRCKYSCFHWEKVVERAWWVNSLDNAVMEGPWHCPPTHTRAQIPPKSLHPPSHCTRLTETHKVRHIRKWHLPGDVLLSCADHFHCQKVWELHYERLNPENVSIGMKIAITGFILCTAVT